MSIKIMENFKSVAEVLILIVLEYALWAGKQYTLTRNGKS